MRVLVVHNHYQQPGGEDAVFADECHLLRQHGDEVATFTRHNDALKGANRVQMAVSAVWNRSACNDLADAVNSHRAEVVHFHNTFPSISPAACHAARNAGAATVQTLHNYRLLCPNALLLRNGKPCEKCLGEPFALAGVIHGCYRASRIATAVAAATVTAHRLVGTWRNAIDRYIAPSELCRQKHVAGGFLPPEKIAVKAHCLVADPGPGGGKGAYALFVGRLSEEKGVRLVLEAWRSHQLAMPLRIAGDGPLADEVKAAAAANRLIGWLGRVTPQRALDAMGDASFLISPSECYETFGRVVVEAFAKGTPVLASDTSAMAELVSSGETGLHFRSGDPGDLACKAMELDADHDRLQSMRRRARSCFERRYTAEANYLELRRIYEAAIRERRGRIGAGQPALGGAVLTSPQQN